MPASPSLSDAGAKIRRANAPVVAAIVLAGSLSPLLALGVAKLLQIDPSSLQGNGFRMTGTNIVLLFAFAALTGGTALLAFRVVHRQPVRELGFTKTPWRALGIGHALGFALGGGIVGCRWALAAQETLTWAVPDDVSMGSLLVGYAFFIVAVVFLSSLKEELLYRAYPLEVGLRGGNPVVPTLVVSALIFAACHLILEPPTVAGFLNRFSFGILAGLVYLRSGSIWASVGVHNGWNWGLALVCGSWRMGGLWSLRLEGLPEWTVVLPTLLCLPVILLVYPRAAAEPSERSPAAPR